MREVGRGVVWGALPAFTLLFWATTAVTVLVEELSFLFFSLFVSHDSVSLVRNLG
jgi:hypothetical protein